MKKITFLLLAMYCYTVVLATNGGSNTSKANLTSVTVFRIGAEMTHQAKSDLIRGNNELVIENISNAPDVGSIQVSCNGNVTVMGIEFTADHLQDEIRTPAIKMLEDSVETVQANLEKIKAGITIVNDLIGVLKANKEIKGTQTGLSVTELVKLMDYYKTRSYELQNELTALQQKEKKWNELLVKLNAQIIEEQKKNTTSTGKLALQLNAATAGRYDFTVTYITKNAYWTPFYDLRAGSITTPLNLVYRARIFQTTGLDWKQVKLSLSTSIPSPAGNAPVFKAWFLSYINSINYYNSALGLQGKATGMNIISNQLSEVVVTGYGSQRAKVRGENSLPEASSPLYIVNGNEMTADEFSKISSDAIKDMQVIKDAAATAMYGSRGSNGVTVVTLKDGLEDYITVSDKQLSVLFDIDLPYDIPTNGKAQTAVLKEHEVPVHYQYYAIPKLDREVFLLADVAGWEKLNLLPGEANIILEGTYIGKSFIDPTSTQDTLNLTMGRDKRVVVKREKLADFSSIKFLGTNKKQTFTYEITVRNNKKDTINMLLKDQFPVSQDKDVNVELLESSAAAVNEETGILNWKLHLVPGEVKKIRISYSVKYPKDKTLNLE